MARPVQCSGCGFQYTPGAGKALAGMCPRCLAEAALPPAPTAGPSRIVESGSAPLPGVSPFAEGARFRDLEIVGSLGSGGMGIVYKARQKSLGRDVALKIIHPQLAASPEFVKRFEHEARAVASLNHPGIVQIHDFGTEAGHLYLVLEHVDGHSLDQFMAGRKPVDSERLMRILRDVSRGLEAVHQAGLVHRDVKPANILIARDGSAKLTDFGLAIEAEDAKRLTESGMFVGTPHYVSPEHAQGKRVDGRSDLYSLGVILYQGLSGRTPFDAPSATALLLKHVQETPPPLHKVAPAATPLMGEIVRKLMAKNPASRYESAAALTRDLERAIAEPRETRPTADRPPLVAARPHPPLKGRSNQKVLVGGAVGAFLLVVILVIVFSSSDDATRQKVVANKPTVAPAPRPTVELPAPEPPPPTPPEKPPEPTQPKTDSPPPAPPPSPEKETGDKAMRQALERADRLLEEARNAYERAKPSGSIDAFTEAGFKAEEARIKYQAVQELGQGDTQAAARERLAQTMQLLKLINDGRGAIGKKPSPTPEKPRVEPAPVVPADVPPEQPAFVPAPAPPAAAKAPIPEAAKLTSAEQTIRDSFKSEFQQKTPTEKLALARLLIRTAQTEKDPAVVWTAFRLAQEQAAAAGDADLAFEAADATAAQFDTDILSTKLALLATVAKGVKTPEAAAAVVGNYLQIVDESLRGDQLETASKAAAASIPLARRANSPTLISRVIARDREIQDLKPRYERYRKARETLSKNPTDAAASHEVGQFLCFTKGDWAAGLRFLAKGSDPALRTLAEKELAAGDPPADPLALADGWYDLAQKETTPGRKAPMGLHARSLYELAQAEATGLVKAKIQKRLAELPSGEGGALKPVDLIPFADGSKTVNGQWHLWPDSIVSPNGFHTRLPLMYQPPDEYDLTIGVTRTSGGGAMVIGLWSRGTPFEVVIDGYDPKVCGFQMIDRKTTDNNPSKWLGLAIPGGPSTMVISVRRNELLLTVDGKKISSFKGEWNRISGDNNWDIPGHRGFYLGSWGTTWTFTRVQLTPYGPGGRPLK